MTTKVDFSNRTHTIDSWIIASSALIVTIIFYFYTFRLNQKLFLIALLVLSFTIVICSPEYLLYLLLFFISNQRLFRYQGESQSFLPVYIIFLFIKIIIKKDYIFDKKLLFSSFFLFIVMIFAGAINKNLLPTDIIKTIVNFFIFSYFLLRFKANELFFKKALTWYLIGVIVSGATGLLYVYSSGLHLSNLRFAAINNDTNYYGVDVALAVSCGLVLYVHFQDNKYLLISIFLFLLGALSISRGYIVANLGNYYLLIRALRKSKLRWEDFLFLIMLALLLVILSDYILEIIRSYIIRMKVDDISGGRIEIWKIYTKECFSNQQNLLFGLGQWDKNVFYSKYGLNNVAHNFFIGALANYGGIVVLMLLVHHFVLYNCTVTYKRISNISVVILLTVLLGYSFLDGFLSNTFQYGFFMFLLTKNFLDKNRVKTVNIRRVN